MEGNSHYDANMAVPHYHLGSRMRQLRERAGLTRKDVARISGVPYRTLTNWESGLIGKPYFFPMAQVAKAIGCQLEEFLQK